MKSKFLRMLALVLVIASLVSAFAVFASAEDADGETGTEPDVGTGGPDILYNRTFDEGWDIENGGDVGNPGSIITFEYETASDYTNNYFWRLEVQGPANTFVEMKFRENDHIGSVMEFDLKSDDWASVPGFLHFGTSGTPSSARNNYNLLTIDNNNVYTYSVPSPDTDSGTSMISTPIATLSNEWTHFAIVWDYTYDHDGDPETEENGYFQYSIYVGSTEEYRKTGELTHVITNTARGKGGKNRALQLVRMGVVGSSPSSCWGSSVCVDNVQLYNAVNTYGQVGLDDEKGSSINLNYSKTIEIISGVAGELTNADYMNRSYSMKVGVDHAYRGDLFGTLLQGEDRDKLRRPILENEAGEAYGAPFIGEDGTIWIAFEPVLEYCGYPVYKHKDGIFIDISTGTSSSFISTQSTTATVGGKRVELHNAPRYATDPDGNEFLVIDLYDLHTILPEYYVDYDPLGLIVISQSDDPNMINRDLDLGVMMDIMKDFVFDYATPEEIIEDVETNTDGFTHPYLHTNQDRFDELRAIYYANEGDENYDPVLKSYITTRVNSGYNIRDYYVRKDENGGYDTYAGIFDKDEQIAYFRSRGYNEQGALNAYINTYGLIQPYYSPELGGSGNGYDIAGGRSNVVGRTEQLMKMAFTWQITRDETLLYAMYDIALALGEWKHWGPGHFLNCADGTAPFATFYDWTYNGYVELYNSGETYYDVTKLADIIYEKGVYEGLLSSRDIVTSFISPPVGSGGSSYPYRDNNWNAVCTAGMVSGALAILDNEKYRDESAWLISSNIKTLMEHGMGQYAPEGAYIESPGYWDYGTSNFFELCSVLQSAAGTTYNMMNCWGIDTTCYFAAHTESSDFRTFNFHDGSMGTQNSEWFMFVGNYFGNASFTDVRLAHLAGGKGVSMYDLFNYPVGDVEAEEMELDYCSETLSLYCARSSWERGALYVGMMGGINKLGHGQIDAGSFVYHNAGSVWFIDLGTENYNSAGFWGEATRYRYYVMKPEGNNTITLTSDPKGVPYGQTLTSTAPTVAYETNEHGSYMVLDMTDTLGGHATSWYRGMMITNDRKTTIIQDELYFEGVQSVWWFGHYSSGYIKDVVIKANDPRTAYMMDKNGNVLRVKIVSARADLKFQIMDTYTFVHTGEKGTFGPEYSATTPNSGGQIVPENNRNQYSKLAIQMESTPSVTFAVVIELIDPKTMNDAKDQIPVGYNFTAINDWEPYADTRVGGGSEDVPAEQETTRKAPALSSIRNNVSEIEDEFVANRAFTTRIHVVYRYLTDVYYVTINFYPDELAAYSKYLNQYDDYKAQYDKFIGDINKDQDQSKRIAYALMGV